MRMGDGYYSWKIIDDYTAVKKTDKTIFKYGNSGVPIEVRRFFLLIA